MFLGLLDEFAPVVLLPNTVGHMSGDGARLLSTLDVEHLVIEENVRFNLLQQRPLGGASEEECLVDLQAPATQGFEDTRS